MESIKETQVSSMLVRNLTACQRMFIIKKSAELSIKRKRHVSYDMVIRKLISDKMREEKIMCNEP